jgi:hypothetical protein
MAKAKKLSIIHTAYTFDKITPIVYKTLSLDRVFTNLLPLIKYGAEPHSGTNKFRELDQLRDHICRDAIHFEGFADYPDIVYKWMQSDLVDLVNRGKVKKKEKLSAPIPLNINTYKLKNIRETFDYGVADQAYAMLFYHLPSALSALKEYLEEGTDPQTDKFNEKVDVDIDWLMIMRLLDLTIPDAAYTEEHKTLPPLCSGQCRIMGDDILRALAYKDQMPRRALIDNIKALLSLHVTLYFFKLIRIIPYLVENRSEHPVCMSCPVRGGAEDPFEECPFQVPLVVDMGDDYHTSIAELARQSYLEQIMQHDQHIRAQIKLKKLHELAADLDFNDNGNRKNYSLTELLEMPDHEDPDEVRIFFRQRTQSLLDETAEEDSKSEDPKDRFDPRMLEIKGLGLSEMDQYIEMLYVNRQGWLQSFFERMLDSLLQRNTDQGLLRSGFGRVNSRKRFAMGSRSLELFVHIGLLEPIEKGRYRTRTLRLDELIDTLEKRYGLFTVRPPKGSNSDVPTLIAFRSNAEELTTRMREIGFYRTLSDAFISQVVQPRYRIDTTETRQ